MRMPMETKSFCICGLPLAFLVFRNSRKPVTPKIRTARPNIQFTFAWYGRAQLPRFQINRIRFRCTSNSMDFSGESGHQTNFYMGDANIFEEEIEEPAKYVPPPLLNYEDSEMIGKTENMLYTMKDFLCTFFQKHKIDWKNCYAVRRLFSRTVEFQDPVICFRGIKSLMWWLDTLSDAPVVVDINEMYSYCKAKAKPCIYIIWTLTLKEDQAKHFLDFGIEEQLEEKYIHSVHYLQNLEENGKNTFRSFVASEDQNDIDSGSYLDDDAFLQKHNQRLFELSGEAKLEINSLGQIASVHISWYLLRDKSEELQVFVRQLLVALLSRKN